MNHATMEPKKTASFGVRCDVLVSTAPTLRPLHTVIVDNDPTVLTFLHQTVTELGYHVVGKATTGTDMVGAVLQHKPDVVVFEIHLPRINGLDALGQIYRTCTVAAVALTADRDTNLIERALKEHVLGYLVKPVEAHHLGPVLDTAWARFGERQQLNEEITILRRSLQNRKIVERAKGVLMKRHRLSEMEAFRQLQNTSMNHRVQMVQIAQAVLNGDDVVQ